MRPVRPRLFARAHARYVVSKALSSSAFAMRAATSSLGTLRPLSMLKRNEGASPPVASLNRLSDQPSSSRRW